MSYEAWGDGPEPFDTDQLYTHGWESDEDGEKWWRTGEPETVYTLQDAIEAYESRFSFELDRWEVPSE